MKSVIGKVDARAVKSSTKYFAKIIAPICTPRFAQRTHYAEQIRTCILQSETHRLVQLFFKHAQCTVHNARMRAFLCYFHCLRKKGGTVYENAIGITGMEGC